LIRQFFGSPTLVAHLANFIAQPVDRPPLAVAVDRVDHLPFRHGLDCRLQFRRQLDIDILAALGALDLDTSILDVLVAKPDDFAAARHRLKRELDQPLFASRLSSNRGIAGFPHRSSCGGPSSWAILPASRPRRD